MHNTNALSIPLGKSLTLLSFDNILFGYYHKSLLYNKITFDLSQAEWVSLFELLLLLQWIKTLSFKGKEIELVYPSKDFLEGIDRVEYGLLSDYPIKEPMNRRKRVLNFFLRLNVFTEINKILNQNEYIYSDMCLHSLEYDDYSDPHEARILPVTSFLDKSDIDIDKNFSNERLRRLLKEHSCLDPIDSGMLANVVIEELLSNAVEHGIKGSENKCAWVSARLVKSSRGTLSELPKWYAPAFRSLLGRHYVELSICDNGPGIYEQLKDHLPIWILNKNVSVKATLDYAFDKFSSSTTKLYSDIEPMPRGLFYVYDLVRQYSGILTVRSGGYYMIYDFLTRGEHPRLLGLYNKGGECTDIGGTAMQIILPQSEGFFLSTSKSIFKTNYREPNILEIKPEEILEDGIKNSTEKLADLVEPLCFNLYNVPLLIDATEFNLKNLEQYHLFLILIKYIIWIEKPNLIWILAPYDKSILERINKIILFKDLNNIGEQKSSLSDLEKSLQNYSKFDLNIIPVLFPNSEVFWLGVDEDIAFFLDNLWGAGSVELSEFGDKGKFFYDIALANTHLINVEKNIFSNSPVLSLALGNYEIEHYLPKIIKESCIHLLHVTPHVINRRGCYHLPHGAYSKEYFYLKPILSKQNYAKKVSRYLTYLLSLQLKTRNLDIDIIVGGTHSAKRLISSMGDDHSCEILTVDRYVGQIDEAIVADRVNNRNVLVVSDVISSGNFVSKIISRLKKESANIKGIACICDIRSEKSEIDFDFPVISILKNPVEKFNTPPSEPIFEVNPISLRPSLPEEEIQRNHIPSLLPQKSLLDWVNNSKALVAAHLVLGPTHYTYFYDTKKLLEQYGEEIFNIVINDANEVLIRLRGEDEFKTIELSLENHLTLIITAEDSNAELYFPEMIRKRFPNVDWIQVERIRLNVEGTWQLDRLDPQLDSIDKIRNKLVLIFDDGSNTGGTLTQLIEVVAEYNPKLILAYCVVNRLSGNRSRFFCKLRNMSGGSRIIVRFLANVLINTFVHSNCPLCNREYPNLPRFEEFAQHNEYVKDLNKIRRWNHLSADSINEEARREIADRGFLDVNEALGMIYDARSLLGYFENNVNIPKKIRDELLSLLDSSYSLACLCYILNREPQLIHSVINYQIKEFDDYFLRSVGTLIQKSEPTLWNNGKIDLVEYLAKRFPDFMVENVAELIKSSVIDHKTCIVFLYYLYFEKDLTKNTERLINILKNTEDLKEYKEIVSYLRGLINSCISWLNIEKIKVDSDISRGPIKDLQSFYREGAPHGEASDFCRPLNKVLNYIHFYEKSNSVRDKENYNSIYRDWRDYTVRCIEERLLYSFQHMKKIINIELSATLQNYYDIESDTGVKKEYLNLQRHLSVLKESEDQISYLKSHKNEIKRQIARITEYLFSETKSPISKVVKSIPVHIIKHIEQRINNNMPWIEGYRIELIDKVNSPEIYGFMTVRIFKQVLDRTFLNIKRWNFNLDDKVSEKRSKLIEPKIFIDLISQGEDIIITIKSNGPNLYEKKPGQGIRDNFKCCKAFGGKFDIYNEEEWVVNTIILKRW